VGAAASAAAGGSDDGGATAAAAATLLGLSRHMHDLRALLKVSGLTEMALLRPNRCCFGS
jgi:hypothetical protein